MKQVYTDISVCCGVKVEEVATVKTDTADAISVQGAKTEVDKKTKRRWSETPNGSKVWVDCGFIS